MRFILSDTARARRLARLLQREFTAIGRPAGLSACLETAARIYGYAGFADLRASLSPVGSPFDEDAGPGVGAARRERHLGVLAAEGIDPATAAAILDRVRPTGRGRGEARGGGSDPDTMLDLLVRRGLRDAASDIHVEPRPDCYAVFFLCLGERRLAHMGPLEEHEDLVRRIKGRSRMDPAERAIGQDGGFEVGHEDRVVHLRVATVPAADGERVLIRILDPDRVRPSLDQLGITDVSRWRRGIVRRNGLCLICGETGSGKTTTLNASVRELDRFERKIYTAEDPVEYRIPFVGQVSTDGAVGYGFAQSIRNFMKADPDVMVLGEVRDGDTARNAVRAAGTGHLVIATMSEGSVLGALRRMMVLGVDGPSLQGVIAAVLVQRLVKVVCAACSGTGAAAGRRCATCAGDGHSDRTVVSECVAFDDPAEAGDVIARLSGAGRGEGLPWGGMLEDAIAKMLAGTVTSDELSRTFGQPFADRCRSMGIDPDAYSLERIRSDAAGGARRRRLKRRG